MADRLNDLLRQTARSFYLTLRVLPAAVRPQIGLAYLLARTTDTIADTEIVPLAQRLDALQKLRERILGQNSAPLNFGELAQATRFACGKNVAGKRPRTAWRCCKRLSPADLQLVREVLATITSGQELDLRRFARRVPSGKRPPNRSRWKRRRNWMITLIAWPAAWESSGRRFAARICFPTRGWMKNNSSPTASGLAKVCSS